MQSWMNIFPPQPGPSAGEWSNASLNSSAAHMRLYITRGRIGHRMHWWQCGSCFGIDSWGRDLARGFVSWWFDLWAPFLCVICLGPMCRVFMSRCRFWSFIYNVPPWVAENPPCRKMWWILWLQATLTLRTRWVSLISGIQSVLWLLWNN